MKMFYGSEHSDLKPANGEYAFIGSLGGLYRLLLGCWSRETCAPRLREKWSESNPTCRQCSITAFLAQDIFGGAEKKARYEVLKAARRICRRHG